MKHKKAKPEKGKKRGDKTPCDTDSTAAKLLPLMQRIHLPNNNPFYLIFRLYKAQFLDTSVRRGLIHPRHLSLAGDGTPIETARWERSKRICDCPKNSDCNWGLDSSRNEYFFGYHLYMFVATDSENDLPVFPLLDHASRHDMLSFLPRDSKEWKLEFNKRTSVEKSNEREKTDYKLEDSRHRSSKMWYCRLYQS